VTRLALAAAVFLAGFSVAAAGPPAPGTTVVPITTHGDPTVASILMSFHGTAGSAGEILLHFTPEGGETQQIRVRVAANDRADAVARALAAALSSTLNPDYTVSRSEPATIKIVFGTKHTPFRLKPAGPPIPGLSVEWGQVAH